MYLSEKRPPRATEDPIQFLRDGWERHINFGLSHPELYLLMYADPNPTANRHSGQHAHPGLRAHMQRIAAKGRLRLPVDRAADLFHAAACGVVMTLLATAKSDRDTALSEVACEAALASLLTKRPVTPDPTIAAAANLLRAQMLDAGANTVLSPELFSGAERALLLEWLARLADRPA